MYYWAFLCHYGEEKGKWFGIRTDTADFFRGNLRNERYINKENTWEEWKYERRNGLLCNSRRETIRRIKATDPKAVIKDLVI